ncbi:MAG: hypothetical protein L0Y67_07390 [Gammaproteobacteria bacterium]|nr:hypothetical protein [Gammaproteobacteria bacterium]MCI0591407.1 hypothetical protein [Gammaproteobacteria bacterium]
MKHLTSSLAITIVAILLQSGPAYARIKLVALPERENTVVRLDHPTVTLVEEERVLTLQEGVNQVDFSWNGVHVDPDSIRLAVLDHPDDVKLINVNYPPNAQALVWDIHSRSAQQERVRISYLLANIDRVVSYEMVTDKDETQLNLDSYLVLRNFSGEALTHVNFRLDYGEAFEKSIADGETKRMLFLEAPGLNIKKRLTFDAATQPWDPSKLDTNVGIPVHYEIANTPENRLGKHALWGGKVRLFQKDTLGSTIFLGEDNATYTPIGQDMKLYIGDSRDLVVTQRKLQEKQTNVRRNHRDHVILYDSLEIMQVEVANFKDRDSTITVLEPMPGEWEMIKTSHPYERKSANKVEFTIEIPAKDKVTLIYHYVRQNVRPV